MSKSRKSAAEPPPPAAKPARPNGIAGVRALMTRFEESLATQDMKISVTEYVRLVQLEREATADEPSDIEVIWIERLKDLYDDVG